MISSLRIDAISITRLPYVGGAGRARRVVAVAVAVVGAAIVVAAPAVPGGSGGSGGRVWDVHVIRELLQVRLLLGQLLLELQQLFLLALADGVVLVGLLALLEGIAKTNRQQGLTVSLPLIPPVCVSMCVRVRSRGGVYAVLVRLA